MHRTAATRDMRLSGRIAFLLRFNLAFSQLWTESAKEQIATRPSFEHELKANLHPFASLNDHLAGVSNPSGVTL